MGDFYIDPWRPVSRAVITHAHSDHARWGSSAYLCTPAGEGVLRQRLGTGAVIQTLTYGLTRKVKDVSLTFYPAGHILGSAQVLIEYEGQCWVVSGDYKTEPDRTCTPFTPVRCDVFITESTFGLPIYKWQPQAEIFADINRWWQANQAAGLISVVYAYSLGKAQRVLAGVDAALGPLVVHDSVRVMNDLYRAAGIDLPDTSSESFNKALHGGSLVVAPPGVADSAWLRSFGEVRTAFASGWMAVRGARRRQNLDVGFALSDHADWPGLLQTIADTGASRVLVTHGYVDVLVRYLLEQGIEAAPLQTAYGDEAEAAEKVEQ